MRAGMLAAAFALLLAGGCGGSGASGGDDPGPREVVADEVLTRQPYLGVSCRTGNSFRCDRVGLSVALIEPASEVDAKIGGRSFSLDDPAWSGPLRDGVTRRFAGFLQPAGLLEPGLLQIPVRGGFWEGVPGPIRAPLELRIRRADGSIETTELRVALGPGWG